MRPFRDADTHHGGGQANADGPATRRRSTWMCRAPSLASSRRPVKLLCQRALSLNESASNCGRPRHRCLSCFRLLRQVQPVRRGRGHQRTTPHGCQQKGSTEASGLKSARSCTAHGRQRRRPAERKEASRRPRYAGTSAAGQRGTCQWPQRCHCQWPLSGKECRWVAVIAGGV